MLHKQLPFQDEHIKNKKVVGFNPHHSVLGALFERLYF